MALDKAQMEQLEKQPFEKCLEQLDSLVREMESGNVPLEEMISKFETGSAIAEICHKKLNCLKQKIEMMQSGKTDQASAKVGRSPENTGDLFDPDGSK